MPHDQVMAAAELASRLDAFEHEHPDFVRELDLLGVQIVEYETVLAESEPRIITTSNTTTAVSTWNDIRDEIAVTRPEGKSSPYDIVRRAKVAAAEAISEIPLIIYAADFMDEGRAAQYAGGLQIDLGDKTGFLQAISDIEPGRLDVLVHSPGGSPTATESIVNLLRSRFTSIRVIIPHTAKSAATMLALSGDEILLGDAAELGPIDPQLRIVNRSADCDCAGRSRNRSVREDSP